MFSKALIALAAAGLFQQAVALGPRGHQHQHQKKDLVTEVQTVTNWVTVTLVGNGPAAAAATPKTFYTRSRKTRSRASSSTAIPAASSPPPAAPSSVVIPTTFISETKASDPTAEAFHGQPQPAPSAAPAPAEPEPAKPAPAEPSAAAPSSAPAVPASPPATGGNKRGLAYNDGGLLPRFLNSGSKVGWTYNWGQLDDSNTGLEFVPTLWGKKMDFPDVWPKNAQKGLDSGSKCLFSFNEPDNGGQANMSPSEAAAAHILYMNPFAGKARIGTPAITNSNQNGEGIAWLSSFFDACGGNCAADFVNIHIYGVDTATFLQHLKNVHNKFNKPVWITEFAFGGSDEEVDQALKTVIHEMDNNPEFSFVERYAYFMAADGMMVKGNSLSSYGNTFAYGS
ncbi:glycosyl hydrolase catalytic core-domain-containing protein [Lasiosphaeria hispida]|uniref:Glycosyl hydrolase catalytic core-domain-containing protein n=1 Tax=Lasiosphaeria hispida TaxID=260671 RepID=A0AAJ0H934_9PEZI|nr:glycosyl hydrolase catalytic core-domain-containing protein [Lasiosphaeria hispida]